MEHRFAENPALRSWPDSTRGRIIRCGGGFVNT